MLRFYMSNILLSVILQHALLVAGPTIAARPSHLYYKMARMVCTLQHLTLTNNVRLCLQDTLGSASDEAAHHATQVQNEGQSYLDSAKDQANKLFGQGQVHPEPMPPSPLSCAVFRVAAQPFSC